MYVVLRIGQWNLMSAMSAMIWVASWLQDMEKDSSGLMKKRILKKHTIAAVAQKNQWRVIDIFSLVLTIIKKSWPIILQRLSESLRAYMKPRQKTKFITLFLFLKYNFSYKASVVFLHLLFCVTIKNDKSKHIKKMESK